MAVPCLHPSTDQDLYQNVPQDMDFDNFDVPQENIAGEVWGFDQLCTTT